MEMLAEMEGSEETLKGLNDAEHRPEDSMQTDEWMYELKHRKSWATGKYVPGSDNEGLKLNQDNIEEGGRAPPNWQEKLSQQQVKLVKESWAAVKDKSAFALTVHETVIKTHPEAADAVKDEQAGNVVTTVDSAVAEIASPENLTPALVLLSQCYKSYKLTEPETCPLFGDAVISSLAVALGSGFTTEIREAWGSAYCLLNTMVQDER
eukprot:TRINITY_DN5812_c1_g1_i1.p1 TRINITY_DN5812_c1_g1~~TRINITY_DN5812_c1_g1_i1.p1  ORF type:complete len:208 (+),score=44.50 TRINITY_DN5812_c1_g1_i1:54-677(+)